MKPVMARRSRDLRLILLLDIVLINAAFVFAYYLRYELEFIRPVLDANQAPYLAYVPFQLWYNALLLVFFFVDRLYQVRRGGSWFEEVYRLANATTTVAVLLIAVTFLIQPLVYSRLLIAEAGFLTIVFLSAARLARRRLEAYLRKRGRGVDRVLIVGAGEIGRSVMRNLVARPELGFQVVGFVDDDPAKTVLGRFKALGRLDDVPALLQSEHVDEVIITLPWMYQRRIMELVRVCDATHVRPRVVPDLFQLSLNRVDFDEIGGIPLLGIKAANLSRTSRLLKRALDVVLASALLVLTAPLMWLITLVVRLESPGPAIFQQIRIGQYGRSFCIYKFRSMRAGAEEEQVALQELNEADGPLFKIRADPRLTYIGRWLRRLSLDELPQLFNVLRGEMSLVGPRPAPPNEVAQYQAWHHQRLEVPQGMTGLWQVSGRSDLTFDEMCLLDIYYIENWSLGLDLTILLRTIPRVLLGNGAY
jgi:exopolysaccharide biosynthesis polyprenyl glycosylphosphotransferase